MDAGSRIDEGGAPVGERGGEAGGIESGTEAGTPGGLGYMIGIKSNNDAMGPATVQEWLGRPVDVAGTTITTVDYLPFTYVDENGAYPLLEVAFPLLSIFGESNKMNDMAEAASGAYDATYESMS